jgi:hypothetical protein
MNRRKKHFECLHSGDFFIAASVFIPGPFRERLRKKIHLNPSATTKFYVDLLSGSLNLGDGQVWHFGRKIACLNEKVAARRPPGSKVFTRPKCVLHFFRFVSFTIIPIQSTKYWNY